MSKSYKVAKKTINMGEKKDKTTGGETTGGETTGGETTGGGSGTEAGGTGSDNGDGLE